MDPEAILKQDISKILETARFAPSVHNTQPWRVSLEDNVVKIAIDKSHKLTHSDPTGRETILSLGIFCEALIVASGPSGLSPGQVRLVEGAAAVEFKLSSKKPNAQSAKDVSSLKTRCTDRSIYKPASISSADAAKIENCCHFEGVTIKVVTERTLIDKIADLTARGIKLALGSPEFRKELSGYLTLPWSRSKRGISVLSLRLPLPLALMEPRFIRWGWGLGTEVRTERRRWLSASGVIFITTAGDVQADWLRAGRAYLRASLAAEQLGLAQATSAATIEASTFHEDVEELLGTKQRLQSASRIGKGKSRKVYSPRLSAEELLVT